MPNGEILTEQQAEELDRLTNELQPASGPFRTPATPLATLPVKPAADRVELKFGPEGYKMAPDPRMAAPTAQADARRVERMCMRASRLEIVSDGTLRGTQLVVDGVAIGGVRRFEMIAQNGFPRVTAVVDLAVMNEQIPEYGEKAGQPTKSGEVPTTVTVDVFRRA